MESNNLHSSEDVSFIIKQLTKGKDLNQISYLEISRAGYGIDMLDIVNELRRNKINFLTSIIQRISIIYGHPLQSFIVSIQSHSEVVDFMKVISRNKGILKIKDSNCRVKQFLDPFKFALVCLPIDTEVINANRLPLCMKYTLSQKYHRFLPSVLLVEILQELKVKNELTKINGLSIKYLSTPRLIDDTVIIRLTSEMYEKDLDNVLNDLGNSSIETLIESQILAHTDIWDQVSKCLNAENSLIYVLDQNLLGNDVLTNGRDIYSPLNRLGPRLS